MKSIFLFLLALTSFTTAQDQVLSAGRTMWGDTTRWGDGDDSTSSYRFLGNTMRRDSGGTSVVTLDSCSRPVKIDRGTQVRNSKLELAYEVRTSSGNTDSSQVKWRIDSRYCDGNFSYSTCGSWVPAGRFRGDTASFVQDSIVSVATASGVTWKPTKQIFDVPGGTQIRLCVDNHRTGGQAGDTTFFRNHVVRTSSIPAGGVPPGGGGSGGAGDASASNQTSGAQKTQIVDGSGNVVATTSNNLNVQCANCSGSGASAADEASFTAGTSTFAPSGVFYQTTATSNALTNGQQGMLQATAQRAAFINLRNASGTEVGTSGAPVRMDPTGTTTQPVSLTSTTITGTVATTQSGTWTVQPGNTANTTAWKVDASSVAVPVTDNSGSLTVDAPVGTPAFVRLSDGSAAITTLPVSNAAQALAQGSTTSGQTGPLMQAAVTTAAPSYTTAQTSPLSLNTSGGLRVDPSGVTSPVSLASVPSHAVTNAGTFATQVTAAATSIGKAEDVASADADVGAPAFAIQQSSPANTAANGDWVALQMSAGRLWVDGSGVTNTVAGVAAHGVSISGNPVRVGMRAGTADITAVTDAQTVDMLASTTGKQIVLPYALRTNFWSYAGAAGGLVTTSGVTIKASAGSGIRNCITSVQIVNEHATIGTEVVIRDGAAGTVVWRTWAQAAGGGISTTLPVAICGSAATLLEVAEVTATATTGVVVSVQGYVGAE